MRPEEKHDLQPFELDYWFCLFVCLLSSSNSFESCQFKKKKKCIQGVLLLELWGSKALYPHYHLGFPELPPKNHQEITGLSHH